MPAKGIRCRRSTGTGNQLLPPITVCICLDLLIEDLFVNESFSNIVLLSTDSNLEIRSADLTHAGGYECVVRSGGSLLRKTIQLHILGNSQKH